MTASHISLEEIADQLAGIGGVLQDDIHIKDDTGASYVPTDKLDAAQAMDSVTVEVLEEYEHEYLISATAAGE